MWEIEKCEMRLKSRVKFTLLTYSSMNLDNLYFIESCNYYTRYGTDLLPQINSHMLFFGSQILHLWQPLIGSLSYKVI